MSSLSKVDSIESHPRIDPELPDRCPACNARQKRRRDTEEASSCCRRCGCDLSVPFAVIEQARRCLEHSMLCAATGRIPAALALADRAVDLYRHDDVMLWRAFLKWRIANCLP